MLLQTRKNFKSHFLYFLHPNAYTIFPLLYAFWNQMQKYKNRISIKSLSGIRFVKKCREQFHVQKLPDIFSHMHQGCKPILKYILYFPIKNQSVHPFHTLQLSYKKCSGLSPADGMQRWQLFFHLSRAYIYLQSLVNI